MKVRMTEKVSAGVRTMIEAILGESIENTFWE